MGAGAVAGLASAVFRDVAPGEVVVGNPAASGARRPAQAGVTRYLITGGAGLIGSHIADLLVAGSCCDRRRARRPLARPAGEPREGCAALGASTIVEGDIRDRALLERLMEGIDVVFHLAAMRITQCAEDPRLALEVLA